MTNIQNVSADNLNAVMEFDRVIRVLKDGTVDTRPDNAPYAPEHVYVIVDNNGQQVALGGDEVQGVDEPWELMRGYTGQYGYNGPVMHPSEFIGGRMAQDILTGPGYYVAVSVECETEDGITLDSPAGWAVAFIAED